MGEVDLKSHLGESLLAKINITDLDSQSGSSCFTVTDASDPPAFRRANVNLKTTSSGHVLSISTHEIINEPIVNLNVSFHCDTNVDRDYVLLLDPAALVTNEQLSAENNTQTEPDNIVVERKQKKTSSSSKRSRIKTDASQKDIGQAQDSNGDKITAKKTSKKKKKHANKSFDVKLIESYIGIPQTEVKTSANSSDNKVASTPADQRVSADKPFLVISNGETASQDSLNKSGMSLRLATEIDFARPEASIASATTTDVLDEATVMSKRLAYLEKQLVNLQSRNAQLAATVNQQKVESEAFNWRQLLLIIFAITAALGVAAWVRHKIVSRREAAEQAKWFDVEEEAEQTPDTNDSVANSNDAASSNSLMGHLLTNEKAEENEVVSTTYSAPIQSVTNFGATQKAPAFEEESRESILDDVNVFIEHGRPTLAIQLLQNFLNESPAVSPAIWLKLLSLLAKEGHETEYNEAITESSKYFKIKTEKFGDPVNNKASIENHTNITSHLEGIWGSPYALTFLNDLIYNKRSQPNEGFNQGEFDDLFSLKQVAQQLDASKPPAERVSLYESNLTNTTIENTEINQPLFSEIDPLDDDETPSNRYQEDLDLISEFNAYEALNSDDLHINEPDDTGHVADAEAEIGDLSLTPPLISNETTASIGTPETIAFELPKQNATLEVDVPNQVEEIDFVISTEPSESTKSAEPAQSLDDFMLEFEMDKNIALDPPIDTAKNKPKKKSKPAEKKQAELNEIEWVLPEITSKPDQ